MIPHTRRWGCALALCTAVVSGVAVFVNGYGVKRFSSPTAYTTAKNLVAACLLLGLAGTTTFRGKPGAGWSRPRPGQWLGLLTIGLIGGGVAFVLFFEGLARASSPDAAFIQKTLVVWVALLAVPLLGERLGPAQVGAIAVLVVGQAALTDNLGDLRFTNGEVMIAAATGLWALEVVVAKQLLRSLSPLTVGASRMTIGVVALAGYLAVRGDLGQLFNATISGWAWALVTGVILTAYVVGWFAALTRAPAVDVTAVLVFGAVITALLDRLAEGEAVGPQWAGLSLIVVGTAAVTMIALRSRAPGPATA